MLPLNQKWIGLVSCAVGSILLALQVHAYFDVGLLSSRLTGWGIGLLVVGVLSWFYYIDDKRSGARFVSEEPPLTDEECEKRFEELDAEIRAREKEEQSGSELP